MTHAETITLADGSRWTLHYPGYWNGERTDGAVCTSLVLPYHLEDNDPLSAAELATVQDYMKRRFPEARREYLATPEGRSLQQAVATSGSWFRKVTP